MRALGASKSLHAAAVPCTVFGQSWDKAEATIVDRDAKFSGDGSVATYTYVADVRLPSGEMFRATIHEPTIATDFWAPSIRDVVSVLVRSKDRKVKFDKDDDRLSVKAYEAAKKKAFQDAQQQPAGTPLVAQTPAADLPDAVAAKLAQLGINGGAPMQVFTADSAQGQAALAAFTHAGARVPPARRARGQARQAPGPARERAADRRRVRRAAAPHPRRDLTRERRPSARWLSCPGASGAARRRAIPAQEPRTRRSPRSRSPRSRPRRGCGPRRPGGTSAAATAPRPPRPR